MKVQFKPRFRIYTNDRMSYLRLDRVALVLGVIITIVILLSSCTSNSRDRNFGGTETIELKPGYRLVNVTWKYNNLWILTKQDTSIKPTQYSFHEKSSLGVMEGEIIIIEK